MNDTLVISLSGYLHTVYIDRELATDYRNGILIGLHVREDECELILSKDDSSPINLDLMELIQCIILEFLPNLAGSELEVYDYSDKKWNHYQIPERFSGRLSNLLYDTIKENL